MGISDPIADMLTRIRNANKAKIKSIDIYFSKINFNIAKILKKTGYINGFNVKKDENIKKSILRIFLNFTQHSNTKFKTGVISGIVRISKPGRRIYVSTKNIPTILNGYGVAILSTSKGILTNKDAKDLNIGGEVICKVW